MVSGDSDAAQGEEGERLGVENSKSGIPWWEKS